MHSKRLHISALVAALLVSMLAFACAGCGQAGPQRQQGPSLELAGAPTWQFQAACRGGEVVHYRNRDEVQFFQAAWPWGSAKYWQGTVATDGCGLCSYTAAIDMLKGIPLTPDQMLAMRGDWRGGEQRPGKRAGTPGRVTHRAWTRRHFGVRTTEMPVNARGLGRGLRKGSVCLVCAEGKVFHDRQGRYRTSKGHFIAVYRHDRRGWHVQDSFYPPERGRDVCYSESEMRKLLDNAVSVTRFSRR